MPDSTRKASKRGWTTVAFGDVVRQVKDRIDPEASGLDRYVAGEHMDTDDLCIRRWGLVGDGYLGPAFHMRFKPGHVLYGSRRTYLRKVALADFEGITANTTYVLESSDPEVLLPELLPFIMQTEAFSQHSVRESKGSVNPYVNFSDLAWFEFALPPIEEQQRIAELCLAADWTASALEDAEHAAKMAWRAAIEERERQWVHTIRPLGELLASIQAGKSVMGVERTRAPGERAVLKVSAIDPLGFQPHESKVLLAQHEFKPELSIRSGDLLMTRSNTSELVGETCLVNCDYEELMLCDKTLRLMPRPDVSPALLWHMLQSRRVRREIEAVATGTGGAMKNISQPKIKALLVCVPKTSNQASSAARDLGTLFGAYMRVRARVASARQTRSRVLNASLKG